MAYIVQSFNPSSYAGNRNSNWLKFSVPYEDGDQILVFVWGYSSTATISGFNKIAVGTRIVLLSRTMTGSGTTLLTVNTNADVPYLNGVAHVVRGAKPIQLSLAKQGLNNTFSFPTKEKNIVLSFAGTIDSRVVHDTEISYPYQREAGSRITVPYNTSVISISCEASSNIVMSGLPAFDLWDATAIAQIPIEDDEQGRELLKTPLSHDYNSFSANGSSYGVPMGSMIMKKDAVFSHIFLYGATIHSGELMTKVVLKNVTKNTFHETHGMNLNRRSGFLGNSNPAKYVEIRFNFKETIEVSEGDVLAFAVSDNRTAIDNSSNNGYSGCYSSNVPIKNDYFVAVYNKNQSDSTSARIRLNRVQSDGRYQTDGTNSTVTQETASNKVLWALGMDGFTNNPPTMPGLFNEQPLTESTHLSNEVVNLKWGVSTDPDEDLITYTLEFYDGAVWNVIASDLSELTYDYTLPNLNTENAQFRVKAVDSKGASSDYRTSNVFTVRRYLTLIQDGENIKTFKNETWQSI